MSFDPSGINWDFGQDDQQPAPAPAPAPMPDNINWGNVFGQVGTAMDNGADFINNNPQYVPDPNIGIGGGQYGWGEWGDRQAMPDWMNNPDYGYANLDRGFAAPQMVSPNDIGFNATPTDDWNNEVWSSRTKYNSYWTPTPPQPTEFSPLEQFQQDLWRGLSPTQQPDGYTYNIPQQQYPPTPETAPEPYLNSWQWKMANNVWDIPPQLPTLPPGTSW